MEAGGAVPMLDPIISPGKKPPKKVIVGKSDPTEDEIRGPSSAVPKDTDLQISCLVPALLMDLPPIPEPEPFGLAAFPTIEEKKEDAA